MCTLAGVTGGGAGERGLSLVELLVVMIVVGVLAVIAAPSFLNQKSKGTDAEAKSTALTAKQAIESCASQAGTYQTCSESELVAIEPTLKDAPDRLDVTTSARSYQIIVVSRRDPAVSFTLSRASNGTTSRTCSTGNADRGGCVAPSTGTW
jgi:type IV pilus assembly protein PilE